MKTTICLCADTIEYPEGGGHTWVYLNWALGLKSAGYDVIWLEPIVPITPAKNIELLRKRLAPYGLADSVALCARRGPPLKWTYPGCLSLAQAADRADLLINTQYNTSPDSISRFERTAMIDIDPGLLQIWLSQKTVKMAQHDAYFTIGETVGTPGAKFPDAGIAWNYTPPCVSLEHWPVAAAPDDARFNTVSTWWAEEWVEYAGESYRNDKRTGFMDYLSLPQCTRQPMELAIYITRLEAEERAQLTQLGWTIQESHAVASTPWDYHRYIQSARGEFSCCKPSCVRLQNGWISDRTLCYLASGKPAIVQHTGPSRYLPDAAGLFRFKSLEEAAGMLETVGADYARQCKFARALAEEHFDARKVARSLVERALSPVGAGAIGTVLEKGR